MARLLRELHVHLSLRVSADRAQLREAYLPVLLDAVLAPLRAHGADGIDEAIARLDANDLTRDDVDAMLELTGALRPAAADPWRGVPPAAKAQFTRKYNSGTHVLPYALVRIAVARGGAGGTMEMGGGDPDAEDEPEAELEAADDDDENANTNKNDEVRRDARVCVCSRL
jgi:replication factor C subunit 1